MPQVPTSYCDEMDLGRSTIIPSHTFMTPQPMDTDPVDLNYDIHTVESHTSAMWSPVSDDGLHDFRPTHSIRVSNGRKTIKPARRPKKYPQRKPSTRRPGKEQTIPLRSGHMMEVVIGENIRPGPDGRLEADRDMSPKEQHQCSFTITTPDGVRQRCERTFKRQEHLKRHENTTHSDRKPYKCPVVFKATENGRRKSCGREFNRHDNLCEHYRTHINPSNAPRNARLTPAELIDIIRKNTDPEHVKKAIPKLEKIVGQLGIPYH
ncbi:hypothetical protein P152DRAFT_459190 [Eremomyces bilateralis CBS 781.70]|uniref:C2H2-type domain-containing protein n=1 Tax=Eremomyces bilateralis CBS 781.70 TaxID=1392243 RepID=A0A6G1G0Z4_9PEZI|nr:uncharacterized protein P152DRAFT_459190 [Eremomyces bilateralis CBS 781.70]KAF1811724.1 hypothetical protein P152DRAFT_459190 [Eremomyces bilateralis CBS 781.70]